MKRIDVIREVADKARDSDALLIANIGIPCKELYSVSDMPNNFYMLGSMGLASSIGLGLALSRPERNVITIDGDGSILMNMGTLATIASQAPQNYLLVIVDNGAYGSTGNQPTATLNHVNLEEVAQGAGNRDVFEVDSLQRLHTILGEKDSGIIVAKAQPGNEDVPVIQMIPEAILSRFMAESSRASRSV
ncbi:sulfopyruvate decarboxylase subunit beta [Methanohalophilus sp.]|uniref:sulfopyruvate decarboxylase subunit beta n=1 Tax=Methanohalophilus sp. TaxID=1966352 RepID=UPI00260A84FB|nr:sulfopyruvate decarboxylase subunit beta [Methanohalophilus sp.]MDK2893064.1 sulfopyruvate decarboxylase subunit beta [Methanohalophilus sp.]